MNFIILTNLSLQIQVSCQNGAGQFEVFIQPAPGTSFCDGQAHEIVVDKNRDKITVTVDSLPSKSASRKGSTSVDTKDTAYFGGIPSKEAFESALCSNISGASRRNMSGASRLGHRIES